MPSYTFVEIDMGTFDRKTLIPLATKDPRSDKTLPNPRSLTWAHVTSRVALKGAEGEHAQLIHGDQWQEFRGSVIENIHIDSRSTIDRNETHTIQGSQQIQIGGNHKETLAQSCRQSNLGPQVVMNGTVRNELRMGAATLVYGKHEIHDDNDGKVVYGDNHEEKYNDSFAAHLEDHQTIGAQLGFVAAQAQITGASAVARGIDGSLVVVHGEATLVHGEVHIMHMENHGPPKPSSIPPEPAASSQPPTTAISHIA